MITISNDLLAVLAEKFEEEFPGIGDESGELYAKTVILKVFELYNGEQK